MTTPIEQYQDPKFNAKKYRGLKNRAKDRGIVFTLTQTEAYQLFNSATECAYTGDKFNPHDPNKFKSFERVDNNKGYQIDNLIIVTTEANTLKSDKTVEHLIQTRNAIEHQLNTVGNVITSELVDELEEAYTAFMTDLGVLYDSFNAKTNELLEPINQSAADHGSNRSIRTLKSSLNFTLNKMRTSFLAINKEAMPLYDKLRDQTSVGDTEMQMELELYDKVIAGIKRVEIQFGIRKPEKQKMNASSMFLSIITKAKEFFK